MTVDRTWQSSADAQSFYVVKEANRQKLFDVLDRKERSKAIVWDQDLMKPFFLIANFKDLQDHGVTQMFPLQYGPAPLSPVEHVIYICRPSLKKMEIVVDNLRNVRKDDQRQYHLIFVPRTSVFCQNKLKEADVLEKFSTVAELPIYAYAWDFDVLSMQNESIFSDYVISGDTTGLFDVSSCLLQLESLFGQFSQCYYKGDLAEQVYRLIKKKRSENRENVDDNRIMNIEKVVLIDRAVDLVTPLVSQLTYEGLIDEIFGIKCTQCKLPKDKFVAKNVDETGQPSTSANSSETMDLVLNSNDELYAELRNLNFSAVAPALSRKIKAISEQQEQRHAATTVRECKEFVKRMPQLLAAKHWASIHMNVAELIKEVTTDDNFLDTVSCEQEILNSVDVDRVIPFIEDATAKGESMFTVLRLICLQSLVTDGLKPKIFDQYRKEFLQSFGYDRLALLCNLQKAGFLKAAVQQKSGKSADTPYSVIRKTYRLIVEDVNEQTPNDLSYVYSGYAPLSARLCQYLIRPGWKTILENLKRIPGSVGLDENMKQTKNVQSLPHKADDKKITLIVFIGGVTLAEISALRYLSETDENHSFLIMTTSIINGKSILNCFN